MKFTVALLLLLTAGAACETAAHRPLLVDTQSTKSNHSRVYHGPTCLGPFCFNNGLMTEVELVNTFGPGWVPPNQAQRVHCYKADNLFLQCVADHHPPHNVVTVFLSAENNCSSAEVPRVPFSQLETREGISIGSSYNAVLDAYGEPDVSRAADAFDMYGSPPSAARESKRFGDNALLYISEDDDLLQSRLFTRSGYVTAIKISVSE